MRLAAGGPAEPRERVAAVVVTYMSDEGLASRTASLPAQVDLPCVIDNGGGPSASDLPGWTVVRNPQNIGVAAALNQGAELGRAAGCRWLLALDQDTLPAPDLVARLLEVAEQHPDREHLAVVASQVEDREMGLRERFLRRRFGPFFERAECDGERLDNVALAISAGSLFRLDVLTRLGGFREEFFVDYVDTDYCLRALTAGYKIAVACRARLGHRLGDRRRATLGGLEFFPTHHSALRWYYIARNRVPMVRRYACRFPFWLCYDLIASAYGVVRMLLFEDDRRRKLAALLLGTIDGLRGRMGPAPAYPVLAEGG